MGFACGIKWVKKDEKGNVVFKQNGGPIMEECIHGSRRAALACTRRIAQVDLSNDAKELKAELDQAVSINEDLVKQVQALMEENAGMTDTCNKVPDLETSLAKAEETIAELEAKMAALPVLETEEPVAEEEAEPAETT